MPLGQFSKPWYDQFVVGIHLVEVYVGVEEDESGHECWLGRLGRRLHVDEMLDCVCGRIGSGVAIGDNHGHLGIDGLHAKLTWGRQLRKV